MADQLTFWSFPHTTEQCVEGFYLRPGMLVARYNAGSIF
jgi:hypothetical protein